MNTLIYILAAFGFLHLLADLATLGVLWWWSREAREDIAKADAIEEARRAAFLASLPHGTRRDERAYLGK